MFLPLTPGVPRALHDAGTASKRRIVARRPVAVEWSFRFMRDRDAWVVVVEHRCYTRPPWRRISTATPSMPQTSTT